MRSRTFRNFVNGSRSTFTFYYSSLGSNLLRFSCSSVQSTTFKHVFGQNELKISLWKKGNAHLCKHIFLCIYVILLILGLNYVNSRNFEFWELNISENIKTLANSNSELYIVKYRGQSLKSIFSFVVSKVETFLIFLTLWDFTKKIQIQKCLPFYGWNKRWKLSCNHF